jgi:hypothetical protein
MRIVVVVAVRLVFHAETNVRPEREAARLSWKPSLRLIYASQVFFAPGSSSIAYVLGAQANSTHTTATTFHLFATTDSGRHWRAFLGTVPGNGRRADSLVDLVVDSVQARILYGQTAAGRLARSLDGGRTWAFIPAPS